MTNTTATQVHLVTVGRSSLFHVEGLSPIADYGQHAGEDTGKGYVTYAPMSACGTLSSASALHRSYVSNTVTTPTTNGKVRRTSVPVDFTPAEALEYAAKLGRKVCTRCTKAAHI